MELVLVLLCHPLAGDVSDSISHFPTCEMGIILTSWDCLEDSTVLCRQALSPACTWHTISINDSPYHKYYKTDGICRMAHLSRLHVMLQAPSGLGVCIY